jgi:hypothetical protein
LEGRDRGRAARRVGDQTGIALEVDEGLRGALAEDAVNSSGVESKGAELALEISDVVTAQRGRAVVQQPVAEREAGLHQPVPRLVPAHPIDAKAASVLEGADGDLCPGTEVPEVVASAVVTERAQPPLQIADGLTGRARPEREAYKNSWSSWRS